jgi:hypothetical protein
VTADGSGSGRVRPLRVRDRGVTPAVSKALEATIVVLFLSVVTATLYGGLVPDYRGAAGDELAERTLSTAAHRVEDAVGPDATAAEASLRVDLPETIAGDGYRVRVDGRRLTLVHPDADVGARTRLSLPDHVSAVRGSWHSHRDARIRVEPTAGGVAVRLVSGDGPGVDPGDGDGDDGDDPKDRRPGGDRP